jgi:succinate dehydrogenase / fumarate reductase iron-sulfur subunit
MRLTLRIWRQKGPQDKGGFVTYPLNDVSPDLSFLETLDLLNEGLVTAGQEPVAFDSDCREGICGTCSLVINGVPHGPLGATTTCQLHMRVFKNGQTITVEPFRARPFPVIRDLVTDRRALDRIIQAGGFISVNTGGAPDANALPVAKGEADRAMDAAQCIGCGACVAACPNGSAMLFVAAKIGHLAHLPQGQPERYARVGSMIDTMDSLRFGGCTNHFECEAACPKEISAIFIAEMNRDFRRILFRTPPQAVGNGGAG